MQAAQAALAAGQRDVQRLGLQLRVEFGLGQRLSAGRERGFDALLGLVDFGAAGLLLVGRQGTQALEQLGHAAGLAQEAGLGVFQFGGRGRSGEVGGCRSHQGVEIVHVCR